VASVGDQQDSVEMRYEDENIWLTQKMMATLYDVSLSTINEHIKKIFADSELEEDSVIRKFRITAADGKPYNTMHYNLQMIIAVGFKVNNERAVQFRKWANQIVKDYTIKGWFMDTPRLKNGGSILTQDYFDRLLEEIREIRLSERKFYQKITDIYATSLDYDRTAKTTKQFFAMVQNKMHFAVHGHTAAELIYERADANKPHMGLTTWENAPDGKIVKSDVSIAKNYLTETEMRSLERIVSAYLDLANPDWAIAFYEGTVKHIYFVAETNGSMSSMQLRLIEESKIHCAIEHFKAISNGSVVYDVVDSIRRY
jgi:hypothetical protein